MSVNDGITVKKRCVFIYDSEEYECLESAQLARSIDKIMTIVQIKGYMVSMADLDEYKDLIVSLYITNKYVHVEIIDDCDITVKLE